MKVVMATNPGASRRFNPQPAKGKMLGPLIAISAGFWAAILLAAEFLR